MKQNATLLGLLICCMYSTTTLAQTNSVSSVEALSIAERQFNGKDVDYYILQDDNQSAWTIFVDAEPMKGWEHDCYLLTIPKAVTTSVNAAVPSNQDTIVDSKKITVVK